MPDPRGSSRCSTRSGIVHSRAWKARRCAWSAHWAGIAPLVIARSCVEGREPHCVDGINSLSLVAQTLPRYTTYCLARKGGKDAGGNLSLRGNTGRFGDAAAEERRLGDEG